MDNKGEKGKPMATITIYKQKERTEGFGGVIKGEEHHLLVTVTVKET